MPDRTPNNAADGIGDRTEIGEPAVAVQEHAPDSGDGAATAARPASAPEGIAAAREAIERAAGDDDMPEPPAPA